jgi:hypothetical protein
MRFWGLAWIRGNLCPSCYYQRGNIGKNTSYIQGKALCRTEQSSDFFEGEEWPPQRLEAAVEGNLLAARAELVRFPFSLRSPVTVDATLCVFFIAIIFRS